MEEVEGVKQCEQEALLNFHKQSAGLDGQARHNFLSKYLNWNNCYSVYLNPLKSELQSLFHSIRAHEKLYQKLQKSNAYAMNVMKKQVENLHSLDYQLQEENK